jgi:membrane glycosyltransferase
MAEKVERISQGVEATALEVERIGEAQRFLTRVLSDKGAGVQIGSGADRS